MNNRIVEPKLKFSEFSKYESWHIAKLKDLAIKITKKNKDSKILRVLTNSSTAGIIDQVEYFERKIVDFNNISSYYIVSIGDDVYNPRSSSLAPVGNISKNKIAKGIVSPLYTVFRFKNQVNDFYEQYFKTSHWHKYLKQNSNMGARHDRISISDKVFFNMPIPYSQEPEQQKIAECLNSIDELIVGEEDKLKELKNHKNGLLQKLFPKNNSSNPELRFPEFKEDWVKTILQNLAKYRRGSFPQPYGLPEWYDEHNGFPFIQVYDVDDALKLKKTTKNKISKLAAQQSVFIPKGTLIITIQGSIGRVAITDYDAYIDRTLLLFEKFHVKINKIFIAYTLQILFSIEKQKAPGGIIKTITKEVLNNFTILIPKVEEQNKIAECLNSIDELISAQTEKIEALKLHKKGLMQGLFPSLEEVKDEQ